MRSYAFYRLPNADQYVKITGRQDAPLVLSSLTELNGKRGFVIAPFSLSATCPVLLLLPEKVEINASLKLQLSETSARPRSVKSDKTSYHRDFSIFHQQLTNHTFSKLVLSRCLDVELYDKLQPEKIFLRACKDYPDQFVSLFSTPQSGTWLMATPEVLLTGSDTSWQTMALAGTMIHKTGEEKWSMKNKAEQQYVAEYIRNHLEKFASNISENGPFTTRAAADLLHLRTDFCFTINDPKRLGDLLDNLHPTPAVCGIPKDAARRFILANETSPRRYYSGFAGMVDPNGETHLYVSLRCMQIGEDLCRLYAGGGILRESTEESEWRETKAKLAAMKQLLEEC